jgi:hypothetical protein
MRKSGLAVASLALAGAAFLLARGERAAPSPTAPGASAAVAEVAEAATPAADAPRPFPAAAEAAPSRAPVDVSGAPAPTAAPVPSRPALAISGRSHEEIRAQLRERSRERAIAAGRLAEWEEREARRAASSERRRAELEARRARASARGAQAREDARRIAAGEPTRPQDRPPRDPAPYGFEAGGEEEREVAGDAPYVHGGR